MVVDNIVNFLSKAFMPPATTGTKAVRANTTVSPVTRGGNPFANPFVSGNSGQQYYFYAKNKPVEGGYFAGYYNGKANVVGQRLFIEA